MPPRRHRVNKLEAIPCELSEEIRSQIQSYTDALIKAAPSIGSHGLTTEEFWRAGLFRSAIEKIRGSQAASMTDKREFVDRVLSQMKASRRIAGYAFTGSGERHDYHVKLLDGTQSVIETKGCLDGNNTTVYQRPPNADEFLIWSLCQNPGADPKHNLWSGVHTRLGGKIIAEKERVDALIVWDMLCGGLGRPCPKISEGRGAERDGVMIPPPCVYLMPRTIPDPRNNPSPAVWRITEVKLAELLLSEFGGDERDITLVHIEARMNGANVERKTKLVRNDATVAESDWTELKRATR
ncbi:MAG: hypothetical protein HY804_09595 [Nitrospinae bacterium]|nr:hypothetical protein [Nitrospinota bacterium]